MADSKYLSDCQGYRNDRTPAGAAPWEGETQRALPHGANGVAFGATVATAPDVAYFLGGYNKDDGFLDSVSRIKADGTWTDEAGLRMNQSKSHFCAVHDEIPVSVLKLRFDFRTPCEWRTRSVCTDSIQDSRGERWMYTIGGWNIEYIKSIHRIKGWAN